MKNKFTVEFGDVNCRNFLFAPLRQKVRGRFSISTLMSQEGGGQTPGNAIAGMPVIPGMHLDVDCSANTYRLWDPLNNEGQEAKDLLSKIKTIMNRALLLGSDKDLKGVNDASGKLSDDELVTMVVHIKRMELANSVSVVRGDLPSDKAIEEYTGRELNDPWNTSAHKPRYADEQDAYAKKIAAARG